ncbi:MAG: prepilin-type N-terminal cleavage/methylation domain-containing protein [Elusimicrobiaceae bacterium]|nr:prepilin-type N-terminal cleavage/methylation domain-containing protein [Elusimicrobiaceae bacterium]
MKRGFTLIEVLVVVLIVGILAGVALPQYHRVVERAKTPQAETMLKSMADAMDLCWLEFSPTICTTDFFYDSSTFSPPTPFLSEDNEQCVAGVRCFATKDWVYWVEEYAYAARVKNGEWIYSLEMQEDKKMYCENRSEEIDYCQMIGMNE